MNSNISWKDRLGRGEGRSGRLLCIEWKTGDRSGDREGWSIPATKKGAIGLAVRKLVEASLEGSFGDKGIPTGTLNFFPRIDDILKGFVVGDCLTNLVPSFVAMS